MSKNDTKIGEENVELRNKEKEKEDNNKKRFSVDIRPEFILSERCKSLPDLRECINVVPKEETEGKVKKKRGLNKKRPRDSKLDPVLKVCYKIIQNKPCTFKDCKYSHDLKSLLENRVEDIKEFKECPIYNLYKYCPFGIMCRVGSSHINFETGANIGVENSLKEGCVKNKISPDLMMQLRKKKYHFECKQHFEKPREIVETLEKRKPIKLIDFRNKVYIAPLTTVGNLPFRRIMKHYEADITCSEMAVASALLQGSRSEWSLVKRHASEDVFGIQLAAAHPDQFTRISEVLQETFEFDFVDLNLGCPLDIICNKGAGAQLMLRESKLKQSLTGISSVLKETPITLKMRTGWDENKPFAMKLISKVQSWGIPNVSTIFIHGRSRSQRYSKLANWDYIQQVASTQENIDIIGNGDVFSYDEYENKLKANPNIFPCAMLARGALIKPWLPTEIKQKRHWDISSTERFDMLKIFVQYGLEHWGSDQQGVNTTRRFLLEWLSFLYRYIPIGMLNCIPQQMNQRPPMHVSGRDYLETLMLSKHCSDWIKLSEMLLGPIPDDFKFQPKHKANGWN